MAGGSFQVGVQVTTGGADLRKLKVWDAKAMGGLCAWGVEAIVERTARGIGADGARFRDYSTRAMTVSFASKTGKRLKPKGGLPAYGRGRPRKSLTAKGSARRGSGWVVTGRFYVGGYAEYKRASRKGNIESGEVDLTLSGQLLRAVDQTQKATADLGIVGIRGQARSYGTHVNDARPFMGFSEVDRADMEAEIAALHQEAIERSQGRKGGGGPSAKPVM